MRRGRIAAGALVAALVLGRGAPEARAWGYIAHRLVVEDAAAAVPEPLRSFFASRTGRLSDLSLEPDTVLKPADSEEGSHHFFNLDLLVENPTLARDMPGDLEAARRRYGTERLARAGILPWWIADRTAALARAMRDGDGEAVLVLSGHLSHYAADLHQPLHLTRNFDGLETHNDGIHMAFERFLIEKRRDAFRPSTRDGEPPPS